MGFFSKILGKKDSSDKTETSPPSQSESMPVNASRPQAEPMCVVVLESEYNESGCVSSTGLHIAIKLEDVRGITNAFQMGQIWGWTRKQLEEIRDSGDNLLLIIQTSDERCGLVSSMQMGSIIKDYYGEEMQNLSPEEVAAIAEMTVTQAEEKGVREIQRLFTDTFGIQDGIFGSERFVNVAGDVTRGPCLFFDFKVKEGMEPLEMHSCIPVAEYDGITPVNRLKW